MQRINNNGNEMQVLLSFLVCLLLLFAFIESEGWPRLIGREIKLILCSAKYFHCLSLSRSSSTGPRVSRKSLLIGHVLRVCSVGLTASATNMGNGKDCRVQFQDIIASIHGR